MKTFEEQFKQIFEEPLCDSCGRWSSQLIDGECKVCRVIREERERKREEV